MAWPPPTLPINRSDATPQQTTHPADHNAVNLAVNDLVAKVTALDAEIGVIGRNVTAWLPDISFGGVRPASQSVATSFWVDLGRLRFGMHKVTFTATMGGGAGGMVVNAGFWPAGAHVMGGFHYFDSGVTNWTGWMQTYGTGAAGLVNNVNNIFGATPAITVEVNDILELWIIASD